MEKKLESLLEQAIELKATDIHFELKDNELSIEFRISGRLRKTDDIFNDPKLLRYLRYLANLDIANSLKPETGSFEYLINDTLYSLRFAYIKNGYTETGVLRILNGNSNLSVEQLTPYKSDVLFMREMLKSESGLIVFCGQTGSGKTTAMYTLLNEVEGRKIYTIEDPIEVYSEKFVQLQINEAVNFDYNAAIKQIMRHDPDIIMVGEIRDEIAAKAAVRAANTGHLVITSIHAASTNLAINRLLDLGVDKNNLQDVLIAVFYQRLFSKKKGGKTAIYERMDQKELNYFFKNKSHSSKFIPIEIKEKVALKYEIIDPK